MLKTYLPCIQFSLFYGGRSTRTCCAECWWNNLRAFYVLLLKKRQENERGIYPRTQHTTGQGNPCCAAIARKMPMCHILRFETWCCISATCTYIPGVSTPWETRACAPVRLPIAIEQNWAIPTRLSKR
jgi:hypothetical protein